MEIVIRMPFPLLLTRTLSRFRINNRWVRLVDFFYSEDVKRPDKAIKIIFQSLEKAGLSAECLAKKIPGNLVLEVGCGRHVGFAPFALGFGARKYIGVDPSLDGTMLHSSKLRKKYLLPAFESARAFGANMPEFSNVPFKFLGHHDIDVMLSRCRFERNGIGQITNDGEKVDICVSISCLEHIMDFRQAAKALAELSHEETIHLHIINFSSHLSKKRPFHQLYEMPYDKFGKLWKYNVNGFRPSDMLNELNKAGLTLQCIPLDKRPEALPTYIDNTWLETYSRDELSIRTALITSV